LARCRHQGGVRRQPGLLQPSRRQRRASRATDRCEGRILLNFRGPEFTFEHVKFVNIFESINLIDQKKPPIYPAERFRDKIVLVGINAEGYEDIHQTPLSRVFPASSCTPPRSTTSCTAIPCTHRPGTCRSPPRQSPPPQPQCSCCPA